MTRAVLEGVSFGLRDSFELIRTAGGADLTEVRASGGGTRSPVWRQILAVGAGWFEDAASASAAWLRLDPPTSPGAAVARYDDLYQVYRDLYPTLRPVMHRLGAF